MDKLKEKTWSLCRSALTRVLCSRPTPNHIGFIMDGNRRYARTNGMETVEGHSKGFEALLDSLHWCLELGIACVSVYAFSIDNYNRNVREVDGLMNLAEVKFLELSRKESKLREKGIRVQVVGDLSLAPVPVQEAARRIQAATQHNDICTLNICFSYTSSQELEHAMHRASECSRTGKHHIDDFLYTCGCPPVDILIRTSGETRLSDFMTRQCSCCLLFFSPVLWPEFSYMELMYAIVLYQKHYNTIVEARELLNEAKQAALVKAALGLCRSSGFSEEHVVKKSISNSPNSVATPEDSSSVESDDLEGCDVLGHPVLV